jgi:hypothetical protein
MNARTMQGYTIAGASQRTVMIAANLESSSLSIKQPKYYLLAVAFFVLAIAPAFAQIPITTLYNTGVDDNHHSLGSKGAVDSHYKIVSGPGALYGPDFTGGLGYTVTPLFELWVSPLPGSEWINSGDYGSSDPGDVPAGAYDYQTSFDLCCVDPETVVLSLFFAADNNACIYVNGVSTNVCTVGGALYGFLQYTNATIPYSHQAPFVPGVNRLDFVVTNYTDHYGNPTPSGLIVYIRGTGR